MATLQLDETPYRSYQELRSDHLPVFFSSATKRLFWCLDSAFPAAISVMRTLRSPDDLEAYFHPGSGAAWHDISQLPLTEPKISSIEASVYDLEQWEFDWIKWHQDHPRGEYVTYGDLSDEERPYANEPKEDGSWEEESDMEFLVKCCGEDRPLKKRGIKLVVTPSAGHHFVTIHDFISAVHPWLISLREDVLKRKTVARPQPYSALGLADLKWMVDEGPEHKIEEKQSWIQEHSPPRPMTASSIAILEKICARRNK